MTILEVSAQEYKNAIEHHQHIFNTAAFCEINRHKADAVRYLLFADGGKTRFGMVLGERGGKLLTPFSAPFGGFSANKQQRLDIIEEAVKALAEYAKSVGKPIYIVLPPAFYAPTLINSCVNILSRHAKLEYIDLNFFFPLDKFKGYEEGLEKSARKNLKRGMSAGFEFVAIQRDDTEGLRRTYSVIKANREEHDYRLSMTLDDVEKTVRTVPADFFLLQYEGKDVAAAQIFHVAEGIAQVIYWGDLRAYSHLRPMNYFAYRLFMHYQREGLRILDIGPSTMDGTPNYGLCDFKTAIGCEITPKFAFMIKGEEKQEEDN